MTLIKILVPEISPLIRDSGVNSTGIVLMVIHLFRDPLTCTWIIRHGTSIVAALCEVHNAYCNLPVSQERPVQSKYLWRILSQGRR